MSEPVYFETIFLESADGAAGFPACDHKHTDSALLDTRRSAMDGLTATPQITGPCPNARLLMLTQPEAQNPRSTACEAGVHRYMLEKNLFERHETIRSNSQAEHVWPQPHPVA